MYFNVRLYRVQKNKSSHVELISYTLIQKVIKNRMQDGAYFDYHSSSNVLNIRHSLC